MWVVFERGADVLSLQWHRYDYGVNGAARISHKPHPTRLNSR